MRLLGLCQLKPSQCWVLDIAALLRWLASWGMHAPAGGVGLAQDFHEGCTGDRWQWQHQRYVESVWERAGGNGIAPPLPQSRGLARFVLLHERSHLQLLQTSKFS